MEMLHTFIEILEEKSITGLELMQNVTESSIVSAMLHDMSSIIVTGKKCMKIAFLNKADNLKALKAGERITALLEQEGRGILDRVVIGELRPKPVIQQCRVMQQRRTR